AWIRLVTDEVAHADELAAGAQPPERVRGGVGIGKRQPADHAAYEIDLFAEIKALLGLAADLMQDLHQHRALDAAARKLRAEVVGREIARQAVADAVGPSVGVPAGPPEMMMRVDHIHQGLGGAKAPCPPARPRVAGPSKETHFSASLF